MDGCKTAVVILAAGKGKRMKSNIPKVLHQLDGKPLVKWVIEAAKAICPDKIIIVVGHEAESVREVFKSEEVSFAVQAEQLGTAHAVMQARPELEDFDGQVLVLSGDVPLTKPETLKRLLELHRETKSAVTLLSIDMDESSGYGRIVRDEKGGVIANVEDRDATEEQKKIKEINGGAYVFDAPFLFSALEDVSRDNEQNEYYLPDIIAVAVKGGRKVSALKLDDGRELCGVNCPEDLARLDTLVKTLPEETLCRAW